MTAKDKVVVQTHVHAHTHKSPSPEIHMILTRLVDSKDDHHHLEEDGGRPMGERDDQGWWRFTSHTNQNSAPGAS